MEIIEMPIEDNDLDEKLGKSMEEINKGLVTLKCEADYLKDLFNNKIKMDNHKEKIIDKLHNEVTEYKEGLIEKLTWPLILDLIIAIDNLNKTIENIKGKEELTKEYAIKCINGVKEDLDEILYRQGIEAYNDSDIKFEPKRHKLLKLSETGDIEKDRTISKTVKLGYEMGEKIIRKQLVDIYTYKKEEVVDEITNDDIDNELSSKKLATDKVNSDKLREFTDSKKDIINNL